MSRLLDPLGICANMALNFGKPQGLVHEPRRQRHQGLRRLRHNRVFHLRLVEESRNFCNDVAVARGTHRVGRKTQLQLHSRYRPHELLLRVWFCILGDDRATSHLDARLSYYFDALHGAVAVLPVMGLQYSFLCIRGAHFRCVFARQTLDQYSPRSRLHCWVLSLRRATCLRDLLALFFVDWKIANALLDLGRPMNRLRSRSYCGTCQCIM